MPLKPRSHKHLNVKLTISYFREGRHFIAYCPSLDLSAYASLALLVQVVEPAPVTTIFRVSLYDVDQQGRLEWYYMQDDSLLKKGGAGWVQVQFPLKRFRMPPRVWDPPRNDETFDLSRIGKIEISVVTDKAVTSKGSFLVKNLVARK